MSPWWLRPTAEGAPEEDSSDKKKAEPPSLSPAASLPYSREPEAPAAEDTFHAEPPAPAPADRSAELRAQAFDAAAAPVASYAAAPGPWPMPPYEPDANEEENGNGDAGDFAYAPEPNDLAEADLHESPDLDAADAADIADIGAEPGEEPGSEREEGAAEKRRRSRRGRGGRRRRGAEARSDEEPEEEAAEEETRELTLPPPVAMAEAREARRRETVRAGESFSLSDVEHSPREIIVTVPERPRSADERKIALFCDLENIALGVRDSDVAKFDILLVLERLLEKGKIIVKKAYADWERYSEYKRPFHEAAIELIDIPQKYYSGKNSADIKMVVDAMDLSYSKEHLDTFVLLSGDSDFSPLVSKLKENNKYVIGIGVKNSSSNLLVDNCDEFIYYEDVWRDAGKGPQLSGLTKKQSEVFGLMAESIQALVRENKDVLWGSMIKQTMQRKKPSFNEGYYGYSTFSELLEDAAGKNILKLKKDQRSGTYIVTGFAKR